MAAVEVLAPGTSEASSADIDVQVGDLVIALKAAQPGAEVIIELKDEDSLYWPVDNLNGVSRPAVALLAPGTYRVTRRDRGAGGSCGVFTG